MFSITIATSEADLAACFPVMVQLRSHLTLEEFCARVQRQCQQGYQIAYVHGQNDFANVKAVAGFRLMEMLSHGSILYVDDLVTAEGDRSQGYGAALLDWLAEYALAQGCEALHLDSGVQRSHAHRFYFRQGLTISAFHFQRSL
jgi:GNAT superfamily N-acetyltransferase